jgi:hypothetical protein
MELGAIATTQFLSEINLCARDKTQRAFLSEKKDERYRIRRPHCENIVQEKVLGNIYGESTQRARLQCLKFDDFLNVWTCPLN